MVAYNAAVGLAKTNEHYCYVAVRPAMPRDKLARYAEDISPNNLAGRFVLCATLSDHVTELEIWSPVPHTKEDTIRRLLGRLGDVLRVGDNDFDILPHDFVVDGDLPLFEQYEQQYAQLQTTQSG